MNKEIFKDGLSILNIFTKELLNKLLNIIRFIPPYLYQLIKNNKRLFFIIATLYLFYLRNKQKKEIAPIMIIENKKTNMIYYSIMKFFYSCIGINNNDGSDDEIYKPNLMIIIKNIIKGHFEENKERYINFDNKSEFDLKDKSSINLLNLYMLIANCRNIKNIN